MAAIINEPCTLVYTLMDPTVLTFDDFALIVKSLHSYQVLNITPHPEMNNVHVKLNYQASLANTTAKLGSLSEVVAVSKLNNYIRDDEFARLEQLRRQFGIGGPCDPAPAQTSRTNRTPRGRGRSGTRTFKPRQTPYKMAPQAVASTHIPSQAIYTVQDTEGEEEYDTYPPNELA